MIEENSTTAATAAQPPTLIPTIKISIFNGIVRMLFISLSFFLGMYFVNIGFSGTQIGIIFAINTISSIITILPSGFSNDKFKSKYLIGAALTLSAIQYFGMYATHSFPLIILLLLFGGIGNVLFTTSSESLFYKTTEKKEIVKKVAIFTGITQFMIALGMAVSGILLKTTFSFENFFLVYGIIFAGMMIFSQLILPSTITSDFEIIRYKKDLFRPNILLFILIVFLFAIHYGAEITTYGLFLKKILLLNEMQMGFYMGIAVFFMAIAALILLKKFQQWKAKNVLLGALLLSGLGHIFMTIRVTEISLLFRIIHEIGDAAYFFFFYYGITKLFDLKRIGGNIGIFALASISGNALGALICGPLGATKGYNIPLIVTGGTTLLAFIITIQFLHYFDHK